MSPPPMFLVSSLCAAMAGATQFKCRGGLVLGSAVSSNRIRQELPGHFPWSYYILKASRNPQLVSFLKLHVSQVDVLLGFTFAPVMTS